MDMVLYSLLKKKIDGVATGQVDSVGNYEIRIVNSKPSVGDSNTIYLVCEGTPNQEDKLVVGGQKITCIVFENTMIGIGVLNGNVFFDGYDYLYNIKRVLYESVTGSITATENIEAIKIKNMSIQGRNVVENNSLKKCYIGNLKVGEQVLEFNKELYELPSGNKDVIDIDNKRFTKITYRYTMDGSLTWRSVSSSGGYLLFRLNGYDYTSKPEFVTNALLFDATKFNVPTPKNAYVCGNIAIGSFSNQECFYVSNNVIYLRVSETRIGGTSATAIKTYLKNNPIDLLLEYTEPKVEVLNIPNEIIANKQIDIEPSLSQTGYENYVYPLVRAYLPISNS